jgi:hypothetical protein
MICAPALASSSFWANATSTSVPSGICSCSAAMARSIRSLSAACSSEMGGGGGLRRSRSSSTRASMRRFYSRILWPCLPAGMLRSSFCLFQQIFKLVHALLQLVLLAYPALEFDGAKLAVGYLISHGGCLARHASL